MILVGFLHAFGEKRAEMKMGFGFSLDLTCGRFSRLTEVLSKQGACNNLKPCCSPI
jgi:hypothetical protein